MMYLDPADLAQMSAGDVCRAMDALTMQSDARRVRLEASAPQLLDACRLALMLLTDPDADAFDRQHVEATLLDAINAATGRMP